MAQLEKTEEKVFPREPCDKTLLLSSIKSYEPSGILMGVERVIAPRKNNFGKVTINAILSILSEMPKCRLYELDEQGQYIDYEDEMTGETRRKIHIGEGYLKTVFFPFYANIGKDEDGLDENTKLIITPGTSSYSFFREALIQAGELPSDMGEQAFSTNFAELSEALEGFTFRAKYDVMGKQRKFAYLKCERLEEEDE